MAESCPYQELLKRDVPSPLSGIEMAKPSGKSWSLMPIARASAPARFARGRLQATAPKATLTARSQGYCAALPQERAGSCVARLCSILQPDRLRRQNVSEGEVWSFRRETIFRAKKRQVPGSRLLLDHPLPFQLLGQVETSSLQRSSHLRQSQALSRAI
jgi:hypothetical protein